MKTYALHIAALSCLVGCSTISNITGVTKPDEVMPSYVSFNDIWMNNQNRWRNWDPSLEINQNVLPIYQADNINIDIEADRLLNSFNGVSNTVTFRVLQLSSPDVYGKITKNSESFQTLFTDINESPSIIANDRYTIAPNEIRDIVLDLEQDVKYIVFAFGFNLMNAERSSVLLPIPVVKQNNESDSLLSNIKPLLFWQDEEVLYRQAKLTVNIDIGDQQIKKFTAKAE